MCLVWFLVVRGEGFIKERPMFGCGALEKLESGLLTPHPHR